MPTQHEPARALVDAQIRQFIEDGFVRLDRAFPRELADVNVAVSLVERFWEEPAERRLALVLLDLQFNPADVGTPGGNGSTRFST